MSDYIAGSAEAEVERMLSIFDAHVPTIMSAFAHLMEGTYGKSRDELTETDIAMRAGYSAVHWLAKDIGTGHGEPLYELPSVIDLLKTLKKERTAEGGVARAYDAGFFDGERYGRDMEAGINPRKPNNPYRGRGE